jgi:AcrB/AcrD/AcrF family
MQGSTTDRTSTGYVAIHPLDPEDAAITAAMRAMVSSSKGARPGIEARGQFGALMESVLPRDDVTSTIISVMVSLTLSPALAALLLKPHKNEPKSGIWTTLSRPTNIFFAGFNKLFERLSLGYSGLTRRVLRVSALMLINY